MEQANVDIKMSQAEFEILDLILCGRLHGAARVEVIKLIDQAGFTRSVPAVPSVDEIADIFCEAIHGLPLGEMWKPNGREHGLFMSGARAVHAKLNTKGRVTVETHNDRL